MTSSKVPPEIKIRIWLKLDSGLKMETFRSKFELKSIFPKSWIRIQKSVKIKISKIVVAKIKFAQIWRQMEDKSFKFIVRNVQKYERRDAK